MEAVILTTFAIRLLTIQNSSVRLIITTFIYGSYIRVSDYDQGPTNVPDCKLWPLPDALIQNTRHIRLHVRLEYVL